MNLTQFLDLGSKIELQAALVFPVIVGIVLALAQCFFGFKLFRYLISFFGFALFGFVGYNIGSLFGIQSVSIIVCVALGGLGAFIAYKFYKAGVFLQGFSAGFIIGFIAGLFSNWHVGAVFATALVIGILVGLLTAVLLKPMIIITSSVSGGIGSGTALASLAGFSVSVGMFIGAILAVLGIVYQFFGGKRKAGKHEELKGSDTAESAPELKGEIPSAGTDSIETTEAGEAPDTLDSDCTVPEDKIGETES